MKGISTELVNKEVVVKSNKTKKRGNPGFDESRSIQIRGKSQQIEREKKR